MATEREREAVVAISSWLQVYRPSKKMMMVKMVVVVVVVASHLVL